MEFLFFRAKVNLHLLTTKHGTQDDWHPYKTIECVSSKDAADCLGSWIDGSVDRWSRTNHFHNHHCWTLDRWMTLAMEVNFPHSMKRFVSRKTWGGWKYLERKTTTKITNKTKSLEISVHLSDKVRRQVVRPPAVDANPCISRWWNQRNSKWGSFRIDVSFKIPAMSTPVKPSARSLHGGGGKYRGIACSLYPFFIPSPRPTVADDDGTNDGGDRWGISIEFGGVEIRWPGDWVKSIMISIFEQAISS